MLRAGLSAAGREPGVQPRLAVIPASALCFLLSPTGKVQCCCSAKGQELGHGDAKAERKRVRVCLCCLSLWDLSPSH